MRVYKPSGIKWLGEIPKHWEIKKIKTIFNIGRGRVISQQELEEMGNYPVYSSQTKNNGILGYIQTYDFDCTQITWTTDGVNAGTIFLRSGKHNCTNVCGTLRPKQDENMSFLSYAIKIATPHYKRPDTNGAKIMNNEMANIEIVYPPLQEQKEIAEFLDKKCEKIQNYINKKQKLITLLQEKKQALINEAVTKGLNPNIESKNSGIEYLGLIPHHWEVKKLKYLATLRNQKSNDSDFKVGLENIESQTGKYISTNEVVFEDSGIYFYKNDILFGKLRPYLAKVFLADREGVCVSEFLVLTPKKQCGNFLKFLMLSPLFISVVDGSTYGSKMPRASWEFIGNLKIPLPPLHEQKEIAAFLDSKVAQIDSVIEKTKKQIELVKEYKNTLINEAICGRINLERK
ncbi:restriction endonuclease subunit S [Campylobacter felis]|uniref:restriction endonuclease subunit S n=1 Tax=Campylobacter felis TaxID=2974565 RepID=UPI0025686EFB|nr:restriction endonuclease subunit S [Campylobacter felis]